MRVGTYTTGIVEIRIPSFSTAVECAEVEIFMPAGCGKSVLVLVVLKVFVELSVTIVPPPSPFSTFDTPKARIAKKSSNKPFDIGKSYLKDRRVLKGLEFSAQNYRHFSCHNNKGPFIERRAIRNCNYSQSGNSEQTPFIFLSRCSHLHSMPDEGRPLPLPNAAS